MADLKLEVDYSDVGKAANSLGQLEGVAKSMGTALARGKINQSQYMAEMNRLSANAKRLGLNVGEVRSQLMRKVAATRQAIQFNDLLAASEERLGISTTRSSRGMNRMGVVTQQAGYQVGDFLVQIQSGTNPMVAFGQQATQLAGVMTLFGGKFVLIGAILGVVIPLLTAVGAGIMRTRSAANEASGSIKSWEEALKESREETTNMADEIERLNLGLETNAQLFIARAIQAQQGKIREAEALAEQVAGTDGAFVAEQRLARQREILATLIEERDANIENRQTLEDIKTTREEEAKALERQLETERDISEEITRRNQQVEETSRELNNQIRINQLIARFGQQSVQVELERNRQARANFVLQQLSAGASADQIAAQLELLRLEQESLEQAEKTTDALEELAKELGISVDYAQQLAGIGFGNIWNGAEGASQLASNLALAARMAANYQGREAAFGGARVGEPPIMTSGGIEALPQTLAPGSSPFAGMELEDLLPPRKKTKGAGGPNAVERLQEEIAFRLRILNLSKDERNLQTEIFRITQALGKDRNKYSSEFIANLAQQNLAIQEQERVIEEARQQQEQLADSIANSFGDAFMSIVDGTKSTKDAFKQMAAAIVRDLYQVYVMKRLIGSAEAGTGIAGAIGRLIGLESGGTMTANRPYLVGERGPELVIPGRSATVANADLTNKAMGGSNGVTVVNNINVTGGSDPAAIRMEVAKLMPQITNATKTAVIDARRRGGQMKAAFS